MDDDMPGEYASLLQRLVEAVDPVRLHGGPIAVKLGRRGEDLQGPQPRVSGAQGSHADAAIEHGVRSEVSIARQLLTSNP
jgi:hypothetical protein